MLNFILVTVGEERYLFTYEDHLTHLAIQASYDHMINPELSWGEGHHLALIREIEKQEVSGVVATRGSRFSPKHGE